MSFVELPASVDIRHIDWSLDRPAQVNRAGYTGTRSVMADPWHGKWSARIELAPIVGEDNVRTWRSFLSKLKGQLNTFRVYATEGAQNANFGVTVAAATPRGLSQVTLTGWSTALKEGQFLTINGQLCCATGDQSGDVVAFEPPLRQTVAAGTIVVTSRPYALVALADSAFNWSVDPGTLYNISFDAEEAILEEDGDTPEATPAVSLPTGPITLPPVFNNTLLATLRSTGSRIEYGISPYDLIDFARTGPVNQYYVSWSTGTDAGAGTSPTSPWQSLSYALANAASPAVINLLDEYVGANGFFPVPYSVNGKFKIKGRHGRTRIHARRENEDVSTFAWSPSGGAGAYVSTASRAASVYRAHFDGNYRDSNGVPTPLTLAASSAACQSTPGTFYWNGGTSSLYVHMLDGRVPDPDNGWLYHEPFGAYEIEQTATTSAGVILYEDLEFFANCGNAPGVGGHRYRPVSTGSANGTRGGCKNCISYGSSANGFQAYDADVWANDSCVSAYNRDDGFNYHSFVTTGTKGEFITVYEHNCKAYQNGFNGFADQPAGPGTSSNATSSHDSSHIIRTNGYYHHSNGAIVADVNGVVSVDLNCVAEYPTGPAAPKACFWHSGTGAGSHYGMYLWGCRAYDHGVGTVILVDGSGTPNGEADGQLYLQSWRGDTGGAVVGTLKNWSGSTLASLAAAV